MSRAADLCIVAVVYVVIVAVYVVGAGLLGASVYGLAYLVTTAGCAL